MSFLDRLNASYRQTVKGIQKNQRERRERRNERALNRQTTRQNRTEVRQMAKIAAYQNGITPESEVFRTIRSGVKDYTTFLGGAVNSLAPYADDILSGGATTAISSLSNGVKSQITPKQVTDEQKQVENIFMSDEGKPTTAFFASAAALVLLIISFLWKK